MPKYRKKPVVIEAERFFARQQPWPEGVYVQWTSPMGKPERFTKLESNEYLGDFDEHSALIDTLEGPLRVSEGDFVITGIKGERYPCKPDIFAATYEAVD